MAGKYIFLCKWRCKDFVIILMTRAMRDAAESRSLITRARWLVGVIMVISCRGNHTVAHVLITADRRRRATLRQLNV